jgi:site-specific recombinase
VLLVGDSQSSTALLLLLDALTALSLSCSGIPSGFSDTPNNYKNVK